MNEGSKKRLDKNTTMDDFVFKAKKSKEGADTEEILTDAVDADANNDLTSSRLEKDLQMIEEKATSVNDVSKINAVDAEFIPSCCKTKAALVDKCKKVGKNCFVKDKPGEMLLTRKALEEDISVFFSKWHLKDVMHAHEYKFISVESQKIVRARCNTTASRSSAAATKAKKLKNCTPKIKKNNKKKELSPDEVLLLFPKRGLLVGENHQLRCRCRNEPGKCSTSLCAKQDVIMQLHFLKVRLSLYSHIRCVRENSYCMAPEWKRSSEIRKD